MHSQFMYSYFMYSETQTEKNLKAQLETLQQENRDLKRENELLKDLYKR